MRECAKWRMREVNNARNGRCAKSNQPIRKLLTSGAVHCTNYTLYTVPCNALCAKLISCFIFHTLNSLCAKWISCFKFRTLNSICAKWISYMSLINYPCQCILVSVTIEIIIFGTSSVYVHENQLRRSASATSVLCCVMNGTEQLTVVENTIQLCRKEANFRLRQRYFSWKELGI